MSRDISSLVYDSLASISKRVRKLETMTRFPTTAFMSGWIPAGEVWTYASSTTVTVPGNATTKYYPGMKVKFTQTSEKFFFITSVNYLNPDTLLTVKGGTSYTVANAAITDPYFSVSLPRDFPHSFAFNSVWGGVGGTTDPNIGDGSIAANFGRADDLVDVEIIITMGSTTTYGDRTYYNFTLPFPAVTGSMGVSQLYDSSPSSNKHGFVRVWPSGSNCVIYEAALGGLVNPTNPYTWASGDIIVISLKYITNT